jgi:YopT peptidase
MLQSGARRPVGSASRGNQPSPGTGIAVNVANYAAEHRGRKTWGFSQSDLLVWVHYRTWGICAALAAQWIRYHAHEDSLANYLGGGGVGPLNVAKLKEIALDHKIASDSEDSTQAEMLQLWLKGHGIYPLARSFAVKTGGKRLTPGHQPARDMDPKSEAGADSLDLCPNIEHDIVNAMRKYNTCYVRVNFGGKRKPGHAVAAWLGQPTRDRGGDACFFDPNYGEFWFEDKADFFAFFPGFYQAKYKRWPAKFNARWAVLPCAVRLI